MKNLDFEYLKIEKIIGYTFKDKGLLKTAFTHSSYANENRCKSNERLEFFGDSVLGYVVTRKLYNEFKLSEGELSKFRQKLVSEQPLAFIIEELGLDTFILKGKGESKNKFDSKIKQIQKGFSRCLITTKLLFPKQKKLSIKLKWKLLPKSV